ncbi:MAG: transposase [Pseudomonadota bacterium]
MREDLKPFFLDPKTPKQRQYEALRAYVLDGTPARDAAAAFGFSEKTLFAMAHDLRTGGLVLFPQAAAGPKQRRVPPHLRETIRSLRREGLSVADIHARLLVEGAAPSLSTVERVLRDAGFGRLPRRTEAARGLSAKNTLLPQPAANLDFDALKPFAAECQVAGVFFFIPYLLESGLIETFRKLPLPQSKQIGATQAMLSLLALKLIGGERLCHVRQYDHDAGLGLFAGLNVPPKPTYMGTYSCLASAQLCRDLQKELVAGFAAREPSFFNGATINLDFHSIPHFGERSAMEKVWCGSRNKALKGANTFFAQDAETRSLLYANADVLRRNSSREILHFVDYLRDIKGVIDQTLVFDSRLTNYKILGELDVHGVKFITLRRRGKSLAAQTDAIPPSQWRKIKLPIPKRKHHTFIAHENEAHLKGCPAPLRQIIMKDHGRAAPTYVVTNNRDVALADILSIYARRWRIENKLAELADFFNLNALSSPIMVRIHFDILLSVAADFLYHRFAADLPRFENHLAPEIFRRFVDVPGLVRYDGDAFEVRVRKRAHTPVLLGVKKLRAPLTPPWLGGKPLRIVFTP